MNVQRIKAALTSARTWLLEPVIEWSYDNGTGRVRSGELARWAAYLCVAAVAASFLALIFGC